MGSGYWIFDNEISVFYMVDFYSWSVIVWSCRSQTFNFFVRLSLSWWSLIRFLLLYETYLYLHTHCYSFSCSCLCLCLRWAMPCPILGHGLFGSTIFILAPRFWRHRQRAVIIILHEYMQLHNAEAARIWSKVGYMQRENIVAAHVHARFLAQEKTVPAKGNAPVVYTQQCLRKAMQMYQARACTRHTMLAESNACTRHVYMHESDSHP